LDAFRAVAVTGGAQGLGEAICRAMAKRGWAVVVADLDAPKARSVAEACQKIGPLALSVIVDLASDDGPAQMIAQTMKAAGRLDALVNCAAFAPAEAFLDMTANAWDRALKVNVRAVALSMAAAAQAMKKTGGGRIVNITSAAARMALPNYAAYAATKAAVDSLTRSAAVALAPHGILVNSLSPGMMNTELQLRTEEFFCRLEGREDFERFRQERTARIPLGRRSTPEEMAEVVEWLIADAPAYMTAERMNVSGGLDKD
jgi:NAD(P)-dependent dehydrogenase (short-subunit alcohol dehydrogenase family)